MGDQKLVLVVEDEKLLAKAITIQLESAGFKVINAYDGKEGLDIIKKNKPDIILLDIVMPIMDGYELLSLIKADKELNHIPVMILSNLGQEEEIEKGKQLGADEFYIKSDNDLTSITNRVKQIASVVK